MKAYVLSYGQIFITMGVMRGPEGDMEDVFLIPSYGVYIDHPQGKVLVDTGIAPKNDTDEPITDNMGVFNREDYVVERLAELGVKPDDIDYLVLSHLHGDHCGNMAIFKNAVTVAGLDEYLHYAKEGDHMTSEEQLAVYRDPSRTWVLLSEGDKPFELLPGITLYNMGKGHSYAMVETALKLDNDGTILIISDVAYDEKNYTERIVPSFSTSDEGLVATVERTHKLQDELGATVWYGHDKDQFATLKISPEFYS